MYILDNTQVKQDNLSRTAMNSQKILENYFPEDTIWCSIGLLWTDFSCSSDDPDDVEDDPESEDELEDEDDDEDCFFTCI